jgi:hypothetical protein
MERASTNVTECAAFASCELFMPPKLEIFPSILPDQAKDLK